MRRASERYGVSMSARSGGHAAVGGRRGAVTVECLLLVTLVGIGVLVGLAAVRNALVQELDDVASAISAIV